MHFLFLCKDVLIPNLRFFKLNYCSVILSYCWPFNWNEPINFFLIYQTNFVKWLQLLKVISRNSIWSLPSPTNGYLDRRLKKASANLIRNRNWMNVKIEEGKNQLCWSKSKVIRQLKGKQKPFLVFSETKLTENVKQIVMNETITLFDWLAKILSTLSTNNSWQN